jgi:hypothetical protein
MAIETRVRWNPAEKALLIAEAKRAIDTRPLRYMDALNAAQQSLPAGRRRNVVGAWDVPWFVDGLGSAGAAAHATASVSGGGRRASVAGGAPGMNGLREQLVGFFTDVLAEAMLRAQRRTAPAVAAGKTAGKALGASKAATRAKTAKGAAKRNPGKKPKR